MEFKKYSSIINSYQKSSIEQVYLHDYQDEPFIVQEKIHGANFSFWVSPDGEIRGASRSQFLNEADGFYCWQIIREEWKESILKLFEEAKVYAKEKYQEDFESMTLHGELFGGSYVHPDVPNSSTKKVQKGIFYHHKIKFLPFDMSINGKIISMYDFAMMCMDVGCEYVPTLFSGSFKECLSFPNAFESIIHRLYDLPVPDVKSNVCEGVVIKPIKPLSFSNGERVVFKNKNEKWSEQTKAGEHKKPGKDLNIPEGLWEKVSGLVNENRVAATVSKIGEPSMKIIGSVLKAFNLDVIEECKTQGYFDGLDKEQIRGVQKGIAQNGAALVKKYIIENHI